MAEVTLPDEIISEILSPALKVPDYKFSSLGPKSPFAKYSVSSSAALLVCKAWLRVATPLLYNVIVIRSKAQGRALEDALRTNPDLGRFIKKLRVEGGFGSSMHTILKCATNVTDIYLSLQIHSSDSSAGLAMGLPLINPQRLIIFDDRNNPLKNKAVLQLMATLTVCAPKWSNTHTVFLPYLIPPAVRQSFMLTMCSFKNIKIVSLPGFGTTPELLQIGAIPTLEAIEVRNKPTTGKVPVLQSTDPRLNSLVRWAAPHADLPRLK
ncbi:F-box domain-containing protein, partial [Favolaschia claudopus]